MQNWSHTNFLRMLFITYIYFYKINSKENCFIFSFLSGGFRKIPPRIQNIQKSLFFLPLAACMYCLSLLFTDSAGEVAGNLWGFCHLFSGGGFCLYWKGGVFLESGPRNFFSSHLRSFCISERLYFVDIEYIFYCSW